MNFAAQKQQFFLACGAVGRGRGAGANLLYCSIIVVDGYVCRNCLCTCDERGARRYALALPTTQQTAASVLSLRSCATQPPARACTRALRSIVVACVQESLGCPTPLNVRHARLGDHCSTRLSTSGRVLHHQVQLQARLAREISPAQAPCLDQAHKAMTKGTLLKRGHRRRCRNVTWTTLLCSSHQCKPIQLLSLKVASCSRCRRHPTLGVRRASSSAARRDPHGPNLVE